MKEYYKEDGIMLSLLITVAVLALICWALCEFISALVGVLFIVLAFTFIAKMAKEIFK